MIFKYIPLTVLCLCQKNNFEDNLICFISAGEQEYMRRRGLRKFPMSRNLGTEIVWRTPCQRTWLGSLNCSVPILMNTIYWNSKWAWLVVKPFFFPDAMYWMCWNKCHNLINICGHFCIQTSLYVLPLMRLFLRQINFDWNKRHIRTLVNLPATTLLPPILTFDEGSGTV